MADRRDPTGARSSPRPIAGYFSLFASLGTLLCCALPSLLVLVGLGATAASILAALPWLVTLSRHKGWVFGISGLLIAANAWYVFRLAPAWAERRGACDPGQEALCAKANRLSRILLLGSAATYLAGFLAAYAVGPLLAALDR